MASPSSPRRLAMLAVLTAAGLVPAAALGGTVMAPPGSSPSGPFFGQPIPRVGASAASTALPLLPGVMAESVVATAHVGDTVSGHARLRFGHDTSVGATFTWSAACSWTFTLTGQRVGSAPLDSASVDPRHLRGTISSGGAPSPATTNIRLQPACA